MCRRHTGTMSNIDKQRIAAVRPFTDMGYVFLDQEWIAPMGQTTPATFEADAMHALLVARADALDAGGELAGGARAGDDRRTRRSLRGEVLGLTVRRPAARAI